MCALRAGRLLEEAWWSCLHLEVRLQDGRSVHFVVEHARGVLTRAAVLREPPTAELSLRISARDLARLYAVDGRSEVFFLARTLRILGAVELVRGRKPLRPLALYRTLRLLFL